MALLKFLKGNYSNLSTAAITEGQVLICGDTGEMFVDVAADKRVKIGDFITVANITALEALDATAVPTSRLYYVEDGNILARSNGTSWVQVNKQPDIATLKTQLGLGSMAYVSEVTESHLSAELAEKVNAASEGNHSHANKALLDTYTQTEADLADAVAKKHEHANKTELDKIAAGDKAKWDAVVEDHLVAADKTALEDYIADVATAVTNEETRAKAAEKANADAITAIKDGTTIDSFADVETALAGKQAVGDYATKTEAQGYADAKDAAIEAAQAKADSAYELAGTKTTMSEVEGKGYQTAAQVQTIVDGKDAAIAEAKAAGDAAQDAVDALAAKVGEVPADKTVVSMIADAQAAATYDDTELAGRVTAVEGDVATIKGDYLKGSDKTELATAISDEETRAKGVEEGLRTDVDVIKNDYLKAADKTELAGLITAEAETARAAEQANATAAANAQTTADEAKAAIDAFLKDADVTTNAVDTLKEIQAELDAGEASAASLLAEINALKAVDNATQDELDAAVATINENIGKKADQTTVDTIEDRVEVLEAIDHEAYKAADTDLKNELTAEINKKADATTVSDMDAAYKAADTAIIGRIEKLENNEAGYATTGEVATAKGEAIAAAKTETETQVKALADGAVATNAADIATLTEQLTWGSF